MMTTGDDIDTQGVACDIWFCPSSERAVQELRTLTVEEREEVWADLSGNETISRFTKADHRTEDEKRIAEALEAIEVELAHIPTKHKRAFLMAQIASPHYVNDPHFRLRFLRADKWDAKASALRMTRHFEEKQRLFGVDLLGRDITMLDLTDEDLKCLHAGGFQFLPRVDAGGRVVLFSRYSCLRYREPDNMVCIKSFCVASFVMRFLAVCLFVFAAYTTFFIFLTSVSFVCQIRALWYMVMTVTNDETVQKLGIISLSHLLDRYPEHGVDYEILRSGTSCVVSCLPIRFAALYFYLNSSVWDNVVDFLLLLMGPMLRVRARAIKGTRSSLVREF